MIKETRLALLLATALAGAPALALAQDDPYAPYPAAQAGYTDQVYAPTPPPPLVEYDQPAIPAPGYIWTPGYWAWGAAGYYWVPGVWVLPPAVGVLWTPPWWGFLGGRYVFHVGYWGPTVGFYGGINYGFGYFGAGFEGAYWRGGALFYNGAVNHFGGVHITNVYVKNVTNVTINRISYNGPGGVNRVPTPAEQAAIQQRRFLATPQQVQHFQAAAQNRALLASVNRGHPPVAAVSRPAEFGNRPGFGGGFHPAPPPGGLHPVPPNTYRPLPPPQGNGYHGVPPGTYRAVPPPEAGGFRPGAPGFAPRPAAPPPPPAAREHPEGHRPPG